MFYLGIPLFVYLVNRNVILKAGFFDNLGFTLKSLFLTSYVFTFKIVTLLVSIAATFIFFTRIFPFALICQKDQTNSLCSNSDIYGQIQTKYWGVGFLKQWRFAYLDRILIATPMIYLCIKVIWHFGRTYHWKKMLKCDLVCTIISEEALFVKKDNDELQINANNFRFARQLVYFAMLANFIANFIVIMLLAHVQIVVRTMSSSPLIYCYLVRQIMRQHGSKKNVIGFETFFFVCYSLLSCVMTPGSYSFA